MSAEQDGEPSRKRARVEDAADVPTAKKDDEGPMYMLCDDGYEYIVSDGKPVRRLLGSSSELLANKMKRLEDKLERMSLTAKACGYELECVLLRTKPVKLREKEYVTDGVEISVTSGLHAGPNKSLPMSLHKMVTKTGKNMLAQLHMAKDAEEAEEARSLSQDGLAMTVLASAACSLCA